MPTVFASPRTLAAVIFDVDGVILASPHEHAWREALRGIADPARFTTEFYQTHVAGKPRFSGARAALEHLAIPMRWTVPRLTRSTSSEFWRN